MTKAGAKKSAAHKEKGKPRRTASGARRIDGAGHIDPRHAERLRELAQETRGEDPTAFVQEPNTVDDLAEELGEDTVASMTTAQDTYAEERDAPLEEEVGGPFVETSASTEVAGGVDESNTEDATREPFPKT